MFVLSLFVKSSAKTFVQLVCVFRSYFVVTTTKKRYGVCSSKLDNTISLFHRTLFESIPQTRKTQSLHKESYQLSHYSHYSHNSHYSLISLTLLNTPYKKMRAVRYCTDPKKLDRLLNRFTGKEFGIAPDSFRLILV